MDAFEHHDWPGNIRELENLIERMVILRHGNKLDITDLPEDFGQAARAASAETDSTRSGNLTFHEAEKKLVIDALNKCGWNRSRAAEYLKIPRHVLIYRMKKYSITEDSRIS